MSSFVLVMLRVKLLAEDQAKDLILVSCELLSCYPFHYLCVVCKLDNDALWWIWSSMCRVSGGVDSERSPDERWEPSFTRWGQLVRKSLSRHRWKGGISRSDNSMIRRPGMMVLKAEQSHEVVLVCQLAEC